jgi:MerR family transcriptional regulator, light-induced transcriptional regulator
MATHADILQVLDLLSAVRLRVWVDGAWGVSPARPADRPPTVPRRRRLGPVPRRLPVPDLVEALLMGDQIRAGAIIDAALRLVRTRTALFADLIQPAQYAIGEQWYEGRIGVAIEHRATGVVESIVMRIDPTPSARPVRPGTTCVLAAVGDEEHVFGLRLLELALEDDGWTVEQLGGRTPVEELMAFVGERRVAFVGLSASYLPSVRAMRQAVKGLHARGVRVLVGGAAFNRVPGLWERIGADGQGLDARVGVVLAKRFARRP